VGNGRGRSVSKCIYVLQTRDDGGQPALALASGRHPDGKVALAALSCWEQ